jgi:hypothetical protein
MKKAATKASAGKKTARGNGRTPKSHGVSAAPPQKSVKRDAKAGSNGANAKSVPAKRKRYTRRDLEKMTVEEVTLLAWEATYANRHRRLTD